jgi:hypothetical protein
MKYAQDCETVFGYFLHHFPYAGLRGEDDEAAHLRIGIRMRELYEDTFDEPYVRIANHNGDQIAVAGPASDIAGANGKTAWSFSPNKQAARNAGKTAWSFAVGNDAATAQKAAHLARGNSAAGTPMAKTAWSFAVGTVDAANGPDIAWSFAPGKDLTSTAGNTAWSFAVGTAVNGSAQGHSGAGQLAFSLDRPRLPS